MEAIAGLDSNCPPSSLCPSCPPVIVQEGVGYVWSPMGVCVDNYQDPVTCQERWRYCLQEWRLGEDLYSIGCSGYDYVTERDADTAGKLEWARRTGPRIR